MQELLLGDNKKVSGRMAFLGFPVEHALRECGALGVQDFFDLCIVTLSTSADVSENGWRIVVEIISGVAALKSRVFVCLCHFVLWFFSFNSVFMCFVFSRTVCMHDTGHFGVKIELNVGCMPKVSCAAQRLNCLGCFANVVI